MWNIQFNDGDNNNSKIFVDIIANMWESGIKLRHKKKTQKKPKEYENSLKYGENSTQFGKSSWFSRFSKTSGLTSREFFYNIP